MNVDFSVKNIPLTDEKTYREMMIRAIEKFQRNLAWRVWHKLNPNNGNRKKETYNFISTNPSPHLAELKDFKNDLMELLQKIKFRKRSNQFLETLRKEEEKINKQKDL